MKNELKMNLQKLFYLRIHSLFEFKVNCKLITKIGLKLMKS